MGSGLQRASGGSQPIRDGPRKPLSGGTAMAAAAVTVISKANSHPSVPLERIPPRIPTSDDKTKAAGVSMPPGCDPQMAAPLSSNVPVPQEEAEDKPLIELMPITSANTLGSSDEPAEGQEEQGNAMQRLAAVPAAALPPSSDGEPVCMVCCDEPIDASSSSFSDSRNLSDMGPGPSGAGPFSLLLVGATNTLNSGLVSLTDRQETAQQFEEEAAQEEARCAPIPIYRRASPLNSELVSMSDRLETAQEFEEQQASEPSRVNESGAPIPRRFQGHILSDGSDPYHNNEAAHGRKTVIASSSSSSPALEPFNVLEGIVFDGEEEEEGEGDETTV